MLQSPLLKTGNGFLCSCSNAAAYHGSPVLRVEELSGNPAGVADRIIHETVGRRLLSWRPRIFESLPIAGEPIELDTMGNCSCKLN